MTAGIYYWITRLEEVNGTVALVLTRTVQYEFIIDRNLPQYRYLDLVRLLVHVCFFNVLLYPYVFYKSD
jgi:hypothetical protein